MARYRGPKTKKSRAFGESIFGFDKHFEKKKYPPGMHGNSRRRRQKSEYGMQLMEKQKAKYMYGLLERQFANLFDKASRKSGVTGEVLLQLLETRLDNLVFRLGIARSRRQARQFVSHKHITVNGKIANIPSMHVSVGDVIGIRGKSHNNPLIVDSLSAAGSRLTWLQWDESKKEGSVLNVPSREDIPENIKEQLIVELYSK